MPVEWTPPCKIDPLDGNPGDGFSPNWLTPLGNFHFVLSNSIDS